VAVLRCNRRHMLRSMLAAGAGVAGGAFVEFASSRVVHGQTNLSPEAALRELILGNERSFNNELTSLEHDLEVLRHHTADRQEPFAAILACADSRVPVELIFDQTIGHLFVTRVAGNVVAPEIIASLEYAVAVLGVKVILVLGHTNCGAVKAAMAAKPVPGQISVLYAPLQRAVERSGGDLAQAVEINAAVQAELLRTSSTVIRDAIEKSSVIVAAGVYDLASGKVALSDTSRRTDAR
jgi:carbonic anhydrase